MGNAPSIGGTDQQGTETYHFEPGDIIGVMLICRVNKTAFLLRHKIIERCRNSQYVWVALKHFSLSKVHHTDEWVISLG